MIVMKKAFIADSYINEIKKKLYKMCTFLSQGARSKFWRGGRVGGQGWGWQQYPIH